MCFIKNESDIRIDKKDEYECGETLQVQKKTKKKRRVPFFVRDEKE